MPKYKPTSQFAICVNTDDADLLTPRMIYEILPDERAAKSKYVRVVDNEGDDYLYPADYFVLVSFPETIQRALVRLPHSATHHRPRRASPVNKRKVKASTG